MTALDRLASDDATIRRIALIELADEEDEAHLPLLVQSLQGDTDAAVRAEAARLLASWETPDAVDALAQALVDDAEAVRQAAGQSLTELKDARLGERLLPWVRHAEPSVRCAALRALRELRVPAAASDALNALASSDASVRREAVGVLGWLKQSDALPALASLAVDDADAEVRRAATGALGMAEGRLDAVLPSLLAALRDPAWPVREEAATTLAKLRPPAAQPALRAAMSDETWQVRLRAARALGRLKNPKALPVLETALRHPIANLRKEAAIALGEIADPAAGTALHGAAGDPDPEVRKAARLSLKALGWEVTP